MPDKNCDYYSSKGIGATDRSEEICFAPLRYGGKLKPEDIESLERHYSCNSNNFRECPWVPMKKRLEEIDKPEEYNGLD